MRQTITSISRQHRLLDMFKLFVRIFSVLFLTTSSWAAHYDLNLFLWNDYIDPKVIKEFSDKFNCRITLTAYEDADTMLRTIQAGGISITTLFFLPITWLPMMVQSNLLAPLRHENIPHLSNLDEKFMNPPFDRGNKFYRLPICGGRWESIFERARPQHLEESWSLIFDAKKRPGPIVLIDSPRDMISAALRYDGHSSNSGNDKDLKPRVNSCSMRRNVALDLPEAMDGRNKVLDRTRKTAAVGLQR